MAICRCCGEEKRSMTAPSHDEWECAMERLTGDNKETA